MSEYGPILDSNNPHSLPSNVGDSGECSPYKNIYILVNKP